MILARKLIIALTIGILAVAGIHAWFDFQEDVSDHQEAMLRELRALAAGFGVAIGLEWKDDGEPAALELIRRTNEVEKDIVIRWAWFDAPQGSAGGPSAPPKEAIALAANGGSIVLRDHGGGDRIVIYQPVAVPTSRPGALEIAHSLAPLRAYQHDRLIEGFTESALTALICAAIVLVLGLLSVGRPMRTLTEMARRIGSGDFTGRLSFRRNDEISQLAEEMNLMCERLEAKNREIQAESKARVEALEQMRHGDRLATVGRLAAGIAHELGTPLNVVSGRAKMIKGDAEALRNAKIIADQSERMVVIIRQLLDFARRKGPSFGQVNLRQLIRGTLALVAPLTEKQGVTLDFDAQDDVPEHIQLDQNQIQQALTNLILNGVQATPRGGRIQIRLTRETATNPDRRGTSPADYVCLRVIDTGTGIEAGLIPHLFEPFFTTKNVGEGTGLGLPVAYGIVADHQGFITVQSELGKGSTFAIFLPTAVQPTQASAA